MNKKPFLEVLIAALIISVIFSFGFNTAIQMTSIMHTGFYRIFKDGTVIGNIKDYDDIKVELASRYGTKVTDTFYFGEGVSMEYSAYENSVELSDMSKLIDDLDIQVDGLRVSTDKGKIFNVASYRDWQGALGDIVKFVQHTDKKDNRNAVAGEVRVMENFRYSYERMPIAEARSRKEVEQELIFKNVFDVKKDTVKPNDTLESVAKRNNISVEQISYVNELDESVSLLPGATLNVSPINYAVEFSYPIIENVTEDIPFEIEYQDDDSMYRDQEEIVQAGVNGRALAQYLSYIINGENVPGERLEYAVQTEPVKQIVKRGTRRRMSFSNGNDAPYSDASGFIWPTKGICISAEYMDPTYGGAHYGLDIAGNYREDIWVAAAGTVESAEFSGAFGNQVVVRHPSGLKTRYAHLSSIGVNPGAALKQGKYVGAMGSTGRSTGVHLHFEVHVGGSRFNPRLYLPRASIPRC